VTWSFGEKNNRHLGSNYTALGLDLII